MSGRRSETIRSKNKRKKLKKKFLLTSKNCWLIDEKLVPFYQHLVDGYSDKLREEWDIEATPLQVKEEPQDDLLDPETLQQSCSNNDPEVSFLLLFGG